MSVRALHERLTEEIRGSTNRDHRKLANNTYGRIEHDVVIIRLHNTDIAEISAEYALYNTGGWFTVTTKERINRWLPANLRLAQSKNVWRLYDYRRWDDPITRFYDGITVADGPDGYEVTTGYQLDDDDKPLRAAIERYVKLYTDDRLHELVTAANDGGARGDCLPCQMGNNHAFGGDHLLYHLAEGYTMATLAVNAVQAAGYRTDIYLGMFAGDYYQPDRAGMYGTTVRRAIRKMLRANLLNRGLTVPNLDEENAA